MRRLYLSGSGYGLWQFARNTDELVRFLTTCENCSFVRKIVFRIVGCVYDILTFTACRGGL